MRKELSMAKALEVFGFDEKEALALLMINSPAYYFCQQVIVAMAAHCAQLTLQREWRQDLTQATTEAELVDYYLTPLCEVKED